MSKRKIYTRKGDSGETSLLGGRRTRKDSTRIEVIGQIDELNSIIGWAVTLAYTKQTRFLRQRLRAVQNELFNVGCLIATPSGRRIPGAVEIGEQHLNQLEVWIDEAAEELPELTNFILPGGNHLSAVLHIARSVCRRAERNTVRLAAEEKIPPLVLAYLNRLGDWLFMAARQAGHLGPDPEIRWQPGKK